MFEIDIEKRRRDWTVALSFTSDAGITALFGPSGAGKTSVLDMVAGLVRPDRGRIVAGGRVLFDSQAGIDLPPEHRRVGYVFQDMRLFPHLRVAANLRYGRRTGRAGPSFEDVVTLLGIGHLLDRWPRALSGGEARRVAIGRALLSGPDFLLLDEPLAHLDRPRADEVLTAITRLRDEIGVPMLYVTHDPREIERLGASRINLSL